jgi:para-nitrobenzyl esterase
MGNSNGQEDCLYLDVYTPPQGTQAKAVMVWIHGGCYVNGSAKAYNGTALATSGDVIVVNIQYRLGVFGYLGADQLRERDTSHHTTGNYG